MFYSKSMNDQDVPLRVCNFVACSWVVYNINIICFIAVEDSERNNGKDKPYFMSPELRKIINVKNEVTPDEVQRRKNENVQMTDVPWPSSYHHLNTMCVVYVTHWTYVYSLSVSVCTCQCIYILTHITLLKLDITWNLLIHICFANFHDRHKVYMLYSVL